MADLSVPLSEASRAASSGNEGERIAEVSPVAQRVKGFVVLTQTCDIVRSWRKRPFVEIAPLVRLDRTKVEEIRRLKRPSFAYVSRTAEDGLVADLDRVMTVEKAIVANWIRYPGWETDAEARAFANAIARKRSRFAFPDDFVLAADRFRRHILDKHNRVTAEGSHLRALSEIRVGAKPSWSNDEVEVTIWFIMIRDPDHVDPDWSSLIDKWRGLFDESGRFRIEAAISCRLEDITARDYVESDVLDLYGLSVERSKPRTALSRDE